MPTKQSEARRRLMAFINGGPVRGPGSGTSDSIPARLSNGEFVLPADTVRKVGIKSLRDLVDITHQPSGRPAHPARFADGGLVDDQQRRPNSFGDAAAAASNPDVTQVGQSSVPDGGLRGIVDRLPSPANTFPGNQLQGDSGFSGAPAGMPKPAPEAPSSASSMSPSGLYMQDRAQEMKDQWGKGNYAQAAGTAARTAVQGLGMYGVEAADKVVSPWVDATKSFGRGLIGADSSAGTVPGTPSAPAPYAGGAGAGRGSVNPSMADPAKPAPTVASTMQGWDRGNMTNAQVAQANPQGVVTARRGANGTMEFSGNNVSGPVSYADAGGKPMDGRGIEGRGWGGFDVAPAGANVATGPNGSYAFASGGDQQGGLSARERMLAAVGFPPDQQAGATPSQPAAAPVGNARERLLGGGARSPVGMSVEQTQREGMIGERVGYNPAYDQRINGAQVQIPAGLSGAQAAQYASEVQAARSNQTMNEAIAGMQPAHQYSAAMDLRDPGYLAMRNASVGSTIYRNKREQLIAAKDRAARVDRMASTVLGQGPRDQADALERYKTDAQLQRESLSQAGANARAIFTQAIEARRNKIASDRLAMEQTEAGFKNRAAQRMEDAQMSLVNAKTPQDQRSARERLLALYGKSEGELWAHSPGGQVVDPKTQQLITQPGVIYNRRTGETRADGGGQVAAAHRVTTQAQFDALPKGATYIGEDGRTYRKPG
ncbi:hypothetical protein SAMN04489707_1005125 [Paenacidovorax caeni]|uniref:Uncharacterized protein n=1 Tax=Paenacidovorax caeni TaxID=343013 RepID=A0A1I7GHV9_9BURK|nr:hypothetical protein [Paenacidovorax caeni]SFU48024.1 hypothetical protein SAMN04489707_1005125 [Paenacidovorax caeni]